MSQKSGTRGGTKKHPEIKSPTDAAHVFFLCVLQEGQPTLHCGILMLQMPINRIQRIAEKEAGEEDGGRASCAAAVHNTQILAQVEDLW
jgi:hypothetical protein